MNKTSLDATLRIDTPDGMINPPGDLCSLDYLRQTSKSRRMTGALGQIASYKIHYIARATREDVIKFRKKLKAYRSGDVSLLLFKDDRKYMVVGDITAVDFEIEPYKKLMKFISRTAKEELENDAPEEQVNYLLVFHSGRKIKPLVAD